MHPLQLHSLSPLHSAPTLDSQTLTHFNATMGPGLETGINFFALAQIV